MLKLKLKCDWAGCQTEFDALKSRSPWAVGTSVASLYKAAKDDGWRLDRLGPGIGTLHWCPEHAKEKVKVNDVAW